jgi:TPR repeat protein
VIGFRVDQAIAWYHKAANQGDANAKHALKSLEGSGLMEIINFELLTVLIGFPVGLWLFLGSLLGGRNLRSGRRAAIAVLGLVFLAHAGLNLYVFHDNTSYFLHKHLVDTARWLLNASAVLIVITVVLRPTKKQDKAR